jgi:hypothetical protein
LDQQCSALHVSAGFIRSARVAENCVWQYYRAASARGVLDIRVPSDAGMSYFEFVGGFRANWISHARCRCKSLSCNANQFLFIWPSAEIAVGYVHVPDERVLSVACDSFGTPTIKRYRLKNGHLCH